MVDTATLRRGDIVRGLLSRKRYRVICVNRHEVCVVNLRLRRFRAKKLFWLGAHELEAI